jgi:uncharacterized membrane-anchored protein
MFAKPCALLGAAALLLGQMYAAHAANDDEQVRKIIDSLHFQTGNVSVPAAHATLDLTPDFRYLDGKDAQRVLTQLWGNPPHPDVLGMIVPTSTSLTEKGGYAVVITYSNDGYVSDADAAKIDYDKMLKDMQEGTRDANAERVKQGYHSVELIGWAKPPHYDAATNKLYWAKELDFAGARAHTLNYDIRVLGREGYLSLNAVASMNQLPLVESEMQKVIAMTGFDAGQRYTDFNASTDKVAAYGIGALVAGAIAAKAGLFAKLFAVLLAFKKVVIAGFIAVAAAVRKFFGGKTAK